MNCSSAMRIADDGFFAHLRQTAFDQRAQGLVIERCLAQKIAPRARALPIARLLPEVPPGVERAARNFSISSLSILRAGWHEQLLFPPDFGAPDHLRQQTAHHRFDWAAIIDADPSGEFEQLFAQDGRVADDRFDRPETLRFAVLENRHDRCEGRLVAKWDAHARADADSFRQCLRHRDNRVPDGSPDQ